MVTFHGLCAGLLYLPPKASISVSMEPVEAAEPISGFSNVTTYVPGGAPLPGLPVLSENLPSGPVWPVGMNCCLASPDGECNVTRMPCSGLPLNFTTPLTGTVEGTERLLLHPASTAAPSRTSNARFRRRGVECFGARLVGSNDVLFVPAAECFIGCHVDRLGDEMHRPVHQRKIAATIVEA